MPVPIVKIEVVRKPGPWGGYKVRHVTAGGRVMHVYEYAQCDLDRLRRFYRASTRRFGQEYVENL